MTTTYVLDFSLPFSHPTTTHQAWTDVTLPAGTWLLRLLPALEMSLPASLSPGQWPGGGPRTAAD